MKKVKHAKIATTAARKVTAVDAIHGGRRQTGKAHIHRWTKTNRVALAPTPKEQTVYRRAIETARKEGYTRQAASLLERAHKKGDRRATYALATWFIHGKLFQRNPKKAAGLLKLAANAGVPEALFDLAHACEVGFGVPKSKKKAVNFYIKAAEKGDMAAVDEVVRCVFWGIGVERNKKLAYFIQDLAEGARKQR